MICSFVILVFCMQNNRKWQWCWQLRREYVYWIIKSNFVFWPFTLYPLNLHAVSKDVPPTYTASLHSKVEERIYFFKYYDNRVNSNTYRTMGISENEGYFQCFPMTHICNKVKIRIYSKWVLNIGKWAVTVCNDMTFND